MRRAAIDSRHSVFNKLLAHYRLDEPSGQALDSSGNGYHSAVVSGATQGDTNAHKRTSYDFDGIDDYVQITASGLITALAGKSVFAMAGWFSSDVFEEIGSALSIGDNGSNDVCGMYPYRLIGGVDKVSGWYNNQRIIEFNAPYAADNSQHFHVFNHESATSHKYYVDNVLEATSTDNKTLSASTDQVVLGAYSPGVEHHNGTDDEIMIFGDSLTADEMTYLYNI